MENAFQSPMSTVPGPAAEGTGQKLPTGLMVLAIACIILGSLGLLGSCLGGLATIFQKQLQASQPGPGVEFQQQMNDLQAEQMIPSLIIMTCNLLVAPALLIGAIGVLRRKSWARRLLRIGLLVAAIYVVVRQIVSAIIQFNSLGQMQAAFSQQPQGPPVGDFIMVGMIVGVVVGTIWTLALTGFYLWGWWYLNKSPIKALLCH